MSLSITASTVDSGLLALPWATPLAQWPSSVIVSLPKGLSRHLVRFAMLSGGVVAVKETTAEMARREYEMLGNLTRLAVPCVDRGAVVAGRVDPDGNPLPAALVTAHLKFSLPYRALFQQVLRPDTATRLVDALAVLLVRLHNVGFFWGDVSLSNTLFRRDAGAFAAYLVDAETGELHEGGLTAGQRAHDLDVARTNIAGEIMDLEASGRLEDGIDAVEIADRLVAAYTSLWSALTEEESFSSAEAWRINERVQKLNDLGFDIGEMAITTDGTGSHVSIQPKVVDAGHHQRRLLRLTGLDVEENQARRLLNDLDSYKTLVTRPGLDEEMIAHEWLTRVFEPVIKAIPFDLRAKLEPAEVFHNVLEHRWYMSQQRESAAPISEVLTSYINDVLRHRRDEATLVGPLTETLAIPMLTPDGHPIDPDAPGEDDGTPEIDWRELV
ncbi:MAG TPA: DUF4032 domain-containing protein [Microbacteriaceae bacterium]|jgi:hypothetical protein|nr:DUF4032 domain-containing protein [Microbacteriaceae bacterium]HQZ48086.1 DUF4032 domain-containing protein [Microbacteriaceae bacterium]HRA09178.1 DUF4032 domain-containing protein [Microbacteriaceae bacterium]